MRHIKSFHGSITIALAALGLDSALVLSACNAWRGSQKADPEKGKATGEVKIAGRILKSGEDKRVLTTRDSIREVAKSGYRPEGALIALSDAMHKLTDTHGAMIGELTLPDEIVTWLDRDTFRPAKPETKPETKSEAETKPVAA